MRKRLCEILAVATLLLWPLTLGATEFDQADALMGCLRECLAGGPGDGGGTICPTDAYVSQDLPDSTLYTFTTTNDGTLRGSWVTDFTLIRMGVSAYTLSGTSDGCGDIIFTATEVIDSLGIFCNIHKWTASASPDCERCGTLKGSFVNTCTGATSSTYTLTSSGGFLTVPNQEEAASMLQEMLLEMGE